jgi:hypothetical protein
METTLLWVEIIVFRLEFVKFHPKKKKTGRNMRSNNFFTMDP